MNQNTATVERIKVLGIDLGKSHFQVHGVDARGRRVLAKALTRSKLTTLLEALPAGAIVAMEACAGAHHFARQAMARGQAARLIAPQFVKPYRKGNKHDRADAEAIVEAATRPGMRFVAVKSVAQQDLQALHRARALAVSARTAQVNQIRGFLLERGMTLPKRRERLTAALPALIEQASGELTPAVRALLAELYAELVRLDGRIDAFDRALRDAARAHPACERLLTAPGIGPVNATALVAAVGEADAFASARHFAAWFGLVPRQHGTGGRTRLYGITKRGDPYLRTLLIHGARAVLRAAPRKTDGLSRWAVRVAARRGRNVAAVALANKLARIAYGLLRRGETYRGAA